MSIPPFVRILRPANMIAIGTLVLASCLLVSPRGQISFPIIVAVLGSGLTAAGGYALNDVFDYETDRLVHKDRVLPKRELGRKSATLYALILLFGSPMLFLLVNQLSLLNAYLVAAALFFYSWKLKNTNGILGNLVTALLTSDAALIGGYVVGGINNLVPLAICVFFATISREIAKDIEDLMGDQLMRNRTIPMLVGPRTASWLGAFSLGLAIIATYIPYCWGIWDESYLIIACAINTLVLFTAVQFALRGNQNIALIQRLIKAEMFLYILLFLLASLVRFG